MIINQSTELEKLNPYEAQAIQLVKKVKSIEIVDDASYSLAVATKKEITSFLTTGKKTKEAITGPIEQLKKAIIAKAKQVMEPAEKAKDEIVQKIVQYEEVLAEAKRIEEERIRSIILVFERGQVKDTVEENQEMKANVTNYYNSLDEADQENPNIKEACQVLIEKVNSEILAIQDREAQEDERLRLEKLSKELDEEKLKLEQEKVAQAQKQREQESLERKLNDEQIRQEIEKEKIEAQIEAQKLAKSQPKAGLREYTKFEIVDANLVPRELCVPSDTLINQAIKAGRLDIPGIVIYKEKK